MEIVIPIIDRKTKEPLFVQFLNIDQRKDLNMFKWIGRVKQWALSITERVIIFTIGYNLNWNDSDFETWEEMENEKTA